MQYRLAFDPKEIGKIVFDDVNEDLTILSMPQAEEDFAFMFLARNYYKQVVAHELKEENITYYNDLVLQLNASAGNIRSEFIEGLLCVDYYRAAKIAENWIKLDLAKRMHY